MNSRILICSVTIFMLGVPTVTQAQSLPAIPNLVPPQVQEHIQLVSLEQNQIVNTLNTGKAGDISLKNPQAIFQFYQNRNFDSFWSNGSSRASSNAREALWFLKNSYLQGLNPENYNTEILEKLVNDGFDDPVPFELMMSDAIIRYGQDMTGIRVKAAAIETDAKSWRPADAYDVLKFVDEQGSVDAALESLEPQDPLYKKLKTELGVARKNLLEGTSASLGNVKFPGTISPGRSHPAIKSIRKFLSAGGQGDVYDPTLVSAVKEFQRANGLKDDGIIGEYTFKTMQRGPMQKLVQIIATMERLRWLPRSIPTKFVEVNIARQVVLLNENGQTIDTIPVIVGRPERPTQDFIANIRGIRFNPSWHVPPTIKSEDLLPALRKSPDALAKKGIELVQYSSDGAKKVDPATINWNEVTPEGLKAYGMVQDPGDKNPLGRIRVLMPNRYDIYLHDTNTPELFSKSFRALSSGCIRVADPKKLANFILGDKEGWNAEKMDQILATSKTKEIPATEMPVYLTYQSVWLDNGKLIYGQDIYDADMKLYNALFAAKKLPQSLQF